MRRTAWKTVNWFIVLSVIAGLFLPAHVRTFEVKADTEWMDIATRADLQSIPTSATGNYRLVNDIDMGGELWVRGITLHGHFDGQGYEIRNLTTENRRTMSGLFANIAEDGIVENLVLHVNIENAGADAGGVASDSAGTISNVYVTGTISNPGRLTGGIVGRNRGAIVESASDVQIVDASIAGGITGENSLGGSITNSYAVGGVYGEETAGGLVGENYRTITNSYAAGPVTGDGITGGLVGYNLGGDVSDSYWDTEATLQSESDGGTGLTTQWMQERVSYPEWDFNAVWDIESGEQYPDLQAFKSFSALAIPIYTLSDLGAMHKSDAYYRLMNDLDFDELSGDWTPIEFYGQFDGNGFTIRNFDINTGTYGVLTGIFSMNTGVIGNLILEEVHVQGGILNTGGLVGSNRGLIDNVSVISGTVEGDNTVGGLAGLNSGQIRNSHAAVTLVASGDRVGGLVGGLRVIDGNTYRGEVIDSYATGSVSANDGVGGLIGVVEVGTEVINSYAIGNVEGNEHIGGLAGMVEADGHILNSYATGDVSGNASIGGLVGTLESGSQLANSYAIGGVRGGTDAGGLVGRSVDSVPGVVNSYWNTDTSGQPDSAGGIGLTTLDMTTSCSYYEDWDSSIWSCEEGQYPKLNGIAADDDYDYVALKPEAIPAGGLYKEDLSVVLSGEEGASIHYTLDGSEPTQSSALYSEPIEISETSTLKAFQIDASGNVSQVASWDYVIDKIAPAAPIALPAGGLFLDSQTVTLSGEIGSEIYYTLDGRVPDLTSTRYESPVSVADTATLKAVTVDEAGNISEVMTETYIIDRTAPVIVSLSPADGAIGVGLDADLMMTFSEPVQIGEGNVTLIQSSDGTVVEDIDVTSSNVEGSGTETIKVQLNGELDEWTWYEVQVDAGAFRDEAGNDYAGMQANEEWTFQTLYVLSSNANLRSLNVDEGTLTPAFSQDLLTYTLELEHTVSEVTVSADVYDHATVTIDGQLTSSLQVSLETGQSRIIPIQVTAEDGYVKLYTVEASRAESPNADLLSLATDVGTLSPAFDRDIESYSLELSHEQSEVTVTAAVYDPAATLTIDGDPVSSKTFSVPTGTYPITIEVIAQNGTVRSYELVINRAAPNNEDEEDNGSGEGQEPDEQEPDEQEPDEQEPDEQEPYDREQSRNSGERESDDQQAQRVAFRTVNIYDHDGRPIMTLNIIRIVTENDVTQDTVNLEHEQAKKLIGHYGEHGQAVIELFIPADENDPADELILSLPVESLQAFAAEGFTLDIRTDHVSLYLSRQSMVDAEEGIRFGISRISDPIQQEHIDHLLEQTAGEDARRVGDSIRIEGSPSEQTRITLPLNFIEWSDDPLQQQAFLASLNVWIHHSNGDIVFDEGMLVFSADGSPKGISVIVNHFSTFTVVHAPSTRLKDIQGHWAEAEILFGVNIGWIQGGDDRTFQPDRSVSRAEFIAMLVRALGVSEEMLGKSNFEDTRNHWAEAYIRKAHQLGWISGVNDKEFRPDEPLTREQMAVIVTRAAALQSAGGITPFADDTDIADWAEKAVQALAEHGIIAGNPDGTFAPQRIMTRAEAAKVLTGLITVID